MNYLLIVFIILFFLTLIGIWKTLNNDNENRINELFFILAGILSIMELTVIFQLAFNISTSFFW